MEDIYDNCCVCDKEFKVKYEEQHKCATCLTYERPEEDE